jgi:hypothetical protein
MIVYEVVRSLPSRRVTAAGCCMVSMRSALRGTPRRVSSETEEEAAAAREQMREAVARAKTIVPHKAQDYAS